MTYITHLVSCVPPCVFRVRFVCVRVRVRWCVCVCVYVCVDATL